MRTIEEVISELRKDIHSDVYMGKRTIGTYLDEILEIHNAEKTGWIPVSERLPNHDEYIKNNGLFNVSDGNRSYSAWFDIYGKQRFGEPTMYGFRVDRTVTAWQPLPQLYKPQESEE